MSRNDDGSDAWSSIASKESGSVLLQRAPSRVSSGRSLLFREADHVVEAWQPNDVRWAFDEIEKRLAQGFYLAGYIAYEAGFALEPSLLDLASTLKDQEPLVWFGCYRKLEIRQDSFPLAPAPSPAPTFRLEYSLAQATYERQVETVREMIAAGETYQLNLTMNASWRSYEGPAELYERLLRAQPVPYAALLHPRPDWHILSLSPELLLQKEKDQVRTRPMKGTVSAGMDAAENRARAAWLRRSEKDRAENVMIVDLLRNDLGRVCEIGSVRVPRLFEVEQYPTVLQMTSTVEGRLRPGLRYVDIFGAIFPSGSIVGAPKIHSMRLLAGLEQRQRGVYTGAIGYMTPDGQSEFSVAIRTVSLKKGLAQLGVGSGITFDSHPGLEYAECMAKTTFLQREPDPPFDLIETLLLRHDGYVLLEEHLSRITQSAEYFGFQCDEQHLRESLRGLSQSVDKGKSFRVRLVLNRAGEASCMASRLQSNKNPVALLLCSERTTANNRFLRHKTTHRAMYDNALTQAQALGFTDSLFQNTMQEVTEGAIHNVVVYSQGKWLTPPLSSGVLPGTYRQHLLEMGRVHEQVLSFDDLLKADWIYICNSVRGLRQVQYLASSIKCDSPKTVWTAPSNLGSAMMPFLEEEAWERPRAVQHPTEPQ